MTTWTISDLEQLGELGGAFLRAVRRVATLEKAIEDAYHQHQCHGAPGCGLCYLRRALEGSC